MYCEKCGSRLEDGALYCSECGNKMEISNNIQNVEKSSSSIGWGILGFFIPISGATLYFAWKQYRPKDAKAAGIGALSFLGFYILMLILIFIFAFIVGFSSVYY